MKITAKFRVLELNQTLGFTANPEYDASSDDPEKQKPHVEWHMPRVKLAPVYPGPDASEEDKAFWEATPNGNLEMTVTNPAAAEFFELGGHYYLTFDRAD